MSNGELKREYVNLIEESKENKIYQTVVYSKSLKTDINLAKITHWLSIPESQREAFSIEQIKTIYHNELLLKRFFDVLGTKPNLTKNKQKIKQRLNYDARAA